jgi:hypothetical protein
MKTESNHIENSILLEICESFDFMKEWNLKKKDCKNIGIDIETLMFRFKESDDIRMRLCN